MLIFHDLKLIQIIVPRTGSNSFRRALIPKYPNTKWVQLPISDDIRKLSIATMPGHYTARQAKMLINNDIWNTYEKIGFVRHPYNWLKSIYNQNGVKQILGQKIDTSLSEFVHDFNKTPYDWFVDENGEVMINTIYCTENLNKILLKYDVPSMHINESQNPTSEEFTGDDITIIKKKFHREFEHY